MSKFNSGTVRPAVHSPIVTERTPSTTTFEGGAGYVRADTKSELFLLAVANMVGENTFYEKAASRDARYEQLVRTAAAEDPQWTLDFLRWLRLGGNMRSAALVGAAQFVHARLNLADDKPDDQGKNTSRLVIDAVLQRADEPGEFLAYWQSTFGGKKFPYVVMKGVSDAVNRLYNQRSLLKYDSPEHGWRFGDVIDICHPKARSDKGDTPEARALELARKNAVFRYALDRRHNRGEEIPPVLGVFAKRAELMAVPVAERRALLDPDTLNAAGMTWEAVAGWLQGPMDAAAWEAIAPSMGLMALTRNLRNFDQAGVSDTVAQQVAARLADPVEVARSRQLPMRFLSAYKTAPSLRWSWPLEQALNASLANVPALKGRTLVLVDRSGSMWSPLSGKSDLMRSDAAAVFGTALAMRSEQADLVQYGTSSAVVSFAQGESILPVVRDRFGNMGGTNTWGAVRQHYRGHSRVVIVTDEQSHDSYGRDYHPGGFGKDVPIYIWNLAGYRTGTMPSGSGNNHVFGGLSDAAFRMIPLLEAGRDGAWPWVAVG